MIAASVLDYDWVSEIKRHAKSRVLFVAEGLFMYFTEDEHRTIFACLSEKFPDQEMIFHTMAPSLIQELGQHSLVSKLRMNAEMQ